MNKPKTNIQTPRTTELRNKFNSHANVSCDDVLDAQDLAEELERENVVLRQHLEKVLDEAESYHIDWEKLHWDGDYRPTFPKVLNEAREALTPPTTI